MLQITWLKTGSTLGVGFTRIVKEFWIPVQVLAVGVIVMVAVMGVAPVFVAVKTGMFPIPPAPRLILMVLFAQA